MILYTSALLHFRPLTTTTNQLLRLAKPALPLPRSLSAITPDDRPGSPTAATISIALNHLRSPRSPRTSITSASRYSGNLRTLRSSYDAVQRRLRSLATTLRSSPHLGCRSRPAPTIAHDADRRHSPANLDLLETLISRFHPRSLICCCFVVDCCLSTICFTSSGGRKRTTTTTITSTTTTTTTHPD